MGIAITRHDPVLNLIITLALLNVALVALSIAEIKLFTRKIIGEKVARGRLRRLTRWSIILLAVVVPLLVSILRDLS